METVVIDNYFCADCGSDSAISLCAVYDNGQIKHRQYLCTVCVDKRHEDEMYEEEE